MVNEFKAKVSERKNLRQSDISFVEYSRKWRDVYKARRNNATQAMYDNIIEKHFTYIDHVKLQDIDRMHLLILLNKADGKRKTQQQIVLTFKQVLTAVADQRWKESYFPGRFPGTPIFETPLPAAIVRHKWDI